MYHYRALAGIITVHIFQFETFRQVVVNLYGTQLPFATNSITHHEVQFWTIKSGFAIFNNGFEAFFGGYVYNSLFSDSPIFFGADIFATVFLVAQGYLGG